MSSPSRYWKWSESQYAEMREKFNHAFEYDETSESFLRWKIRPSQRAKPGDVAGFLNTDGYWRVKFESKTYKVHQIIWIMHGNTIPEPLSIDHADQEKTNNNISNLRLLNDPGQGINRKGYGKSKYKGVIWYKVTKKWLAQIKINRKQKHIGYYDSEIEAARAWDREAASLGRTDLNFPDDRCD